MAAYKINGRLDVSKKGKTQYIGEGTDVETITKETASKDHGIRPKQFDSLVERGVLVDSKAAPVAPAKTGPQPMTSKRFVEMLNGAAKLEEGNKDHWTNDNVPEVAALKDVGITTTAAERDEFWELYNPA